jgi:Thioredoxin like C-terminal domain
MAPEFFAMRVSRRAGSTRFNTGSVALASAAGATHGTDVDSQGQGTADDQRLYQLIRQPGDIEDRTFELEFLDAGVEAYCFTFG